ncbi:MAG: AbrB/MazE/SpoVT family DNA-binding domain-containing protein [Leptospira sp.]|nr:AbrB/MazE/SpoVT family DNA-binding domain-containing protein [Leptospira sp.]
MAKIQSKITSKYQITIPKEIRDMLKVGEADILEWHIEKEGIFVESVEKPFLKYHGFFTSEKGSTKEDIEKAWKIRSQRYK